MLPTYAIDHEVEELESRCIAALKAHTDPSAYELIIIDNGRDYARLPVALICDIYRHYSNALGYARASNDGIRLASGHYIFVLNSDLFVPNGWLPKMIADYERYGPGVLSPQDADRPGISYDDHWYSLWMSDVGTLGKVGLFDESLPFRYHDQDLSIRMRKAGFQVMRTGSVVVQHIESSTYRRLGKENPNLWKQEQAERAEMFRRWGADEYRHWVPLAKERGEIQ